MQAIIDAFPITQQAKQEWLQARAQFRLPYWDWARQQQYDSGYKSFGIPEVFTKDQISIMDYDNKTKIVTNPLVKYVNPRLGDNKKPLPMGHLDMGKYRIWDNRDSKKRVLPVRPTLGNPFAPAYGVLVG